MEQQAKENPVNEDLLLNSESRGRILGEVIPNVDKNVGVMGSADFLNGLIQKA